MPTYSYRCADCGHEFDQVQKITEDPLRDCPSCGGGVKRVIHPVGVVFKGSGWYITDSRKPPAESGDEVKPAAKTDGAKPDGAKADAKPSAAAEKSTANA